MHNIQRIINTLSVYTTPVAPAFAFGQLIFAATFAIVGEGLGWWVALVIGIFAATGLETIGISAGHTAVEAWAKRRYGVATVATAVLLAYVAIGAYELWNTAYLVLFLIAPLAYVVSGLYIEMQRSEISAAEREAAEAQQRADEAAQRQAAAAQQRADEAAERQRQADEQARRDQIAAEQQRHRDQLAAERQRRLDEQAAEKTRLDHEARLAKLAAPKAASKRQVGGNLPPQPADENGGNIWNYRRWPDVPQEVRRQIAAMDAPQLAAYVPHLGDTTRRSWVRFARDEFPQTPSGMSAD